MPPNDDEEWTVEYADETLKTTVTDELGLGLDLAEFEALLIENLDEGKPWLHPPLDPETIDAIDDEELQALAWHLDALARAYNYASDPTLPDLLRPPGDRHDLTPDERHRLEHACDLLLTVYTDLLERVGPSLEPYTTDP